ncbi:MAG: glucose-6-phosphate dehydrogenase, partial [Acidobacteria bacterium]|nr:glucose-6-phosphate dehydrogenase [Acidobacteriota bacterium]
MNNGPPPLFVIFGASGDLTSLKLIPALFRLHLKKRLPEGTRIVGVSRTPFTDDAFREKLADRIQSAAGKAWDRGAWDRFAPSIHYLGADATRPEELRNLETQLQALDGKGPSLCGRVYYLSISPTLYEKVVRGLGEAGMAREIGSCWRRIVIEKPFGTDRSSARSLNRVVHEAFQERQVFRIDHYLGKETVQNLLVFRFASAIFEPIWNRNYIDHVQITVAERVKVGGRGAYYDHAGVLRDMFQNHLMQLLALVAMEAPSRFEADALRNEKIKVLESIRPFHPEEIGRRLVRGQYESYLREKGVAAGSRTSTYAALRWDIDNWRWQGVPFYLRSGKALARRVSEIVIQFRHPPHLLFDIPEGQEMTGNRLVLGIQPDEGVHLKFQTKVPDQGMAIQDSDLEFHFREGRPDQA